MIRNKNIDKIQSSYLFVEINKRKVAILEKNPNATLINLGIGNTTEPISQHIAGGLKLGVENLQSLETYTGYGSEQGLDILREKIATKIYKGVIEKDDIFISDGAKCDIGRLQLLFGRDVKVACQDPAYPVYVDGSVLIGATGGYNGVNYNGIHYMPCSPDNDFFPDLSSVGAGAIIYFCSPNNPTGAVATKEQLKTLVDFALKNKSIIIFDAAYYAYIQDNTLPRSIFEIEGAKKCAIEVNSFSKTAGFTGVRLGWSVVPKELKYDNGDSVRDDWNRIVTTIFNGASNIVQYGGLACLDSVGLEEIDVLVRYYLENANIIKSALDSLGLEVYNHGNAPYLWVYFKGEDSWDVFNNILNKTHIITTPGIGFGPAGSGFIRFSSFGHRSSIEQAANRLKNSEI